VFEPSSDPEPTKPIRTKVGIITFYKVSSGDAAMGTAEETDTYRTFHDGRCYEVSPMVRRQNGPLDRAVRMANNGLGSILRTLYFGK